MLVRIDECRGRSAVTDKLSSIGGSATTFSIKPLPALDAAYLTDILQANEAALLAAAPGDIACERGMTEIAKAKGLAREVLYKALRPGSTPRFDTVNRACAALGVRLVAQVA